MNSVALNRCSKVEPVLRLRMRAWTKALRLPGVRWVNSITRQGWPSKKMTWPRRMSVAFIGELQGSFGDADRVQFWDWKIHRTRAARLMVPSADFTILHH